MLSVADFELCRKYGDLWIISGVTYKEDTFCTFFISTLLDTKNNFVLKSSFFPLLLPNMHVENKISVYVSPSMQM